MISPQTIEAVRELSIVDVISRYVQLKKAGSSWRAPSPFSGNDKTPSFFVVPSKNIFKCFSSGYGGDAIKFVMLKTGKSYPVAIEEIAQQHNVTIEYEQNGHPKEYYDELEKLYKINQAAAKRYAEALLEVNGTHPAFIELINKRRFTADTLAQWEIGYAPGDITEYAPAKWKFLTKTLIDKGYYEAGIELGLCKTTNEVNYDTFRNRIMFPIVDHHGRTVGFGGRALKADAFNVKYINSSESKIFKKSKMLFGLHFATNEIRRLGYANLMEGYTDVISFHQAGLNNTVGTCGTALTEDQCKLLKQYTDKVVLFGDSDEAGQKAVTRAIDELMKFGFQASVVPMPDLGERKVDPDELVRMFI